MLLRPGNWIKIRDDFWARHWHAYVVGKSTYDFYAGRTFRVIDILPHKDSATPTKGVVLNVQGSHITFPEDWFVLFQICRS